MAPKFDLVADVNAKKELWTLLARVIRLWQVSDHRNNMLPNSIEMVLMDSKGCKIQATVRRELMYKFEKELKEGFVYHMTNLGIAGNSGDYRTTRHAYKLKFNFSTKLKLADSEAVPKNVFSFTPPTDLFRNDFESEYLVDVIGILTTWGEEKEIQHNGKPSKMIEVWLIANSFQFKCTLFGSYVEEFNSFIASGDNENAVIAILFAKVKTFQGKPALQNTYSTTKLLFNPECSEAVELRKGMAEKNDSPCQGSTPFQESARVSMADEMLTLTPATTIEGLKGCKEGSTYVVLCTIKFIVDEDNWWYTACKCNKKVYADSGLYFCGKCNKHVMNVTPRYRIQVRVIDETDSATFVLFDRDASLLLNKTCADLLETIETNSATVTIPDVISQLVDQAFLFKVEVSKSIGSRFEPNFCVRRVSNDPDILKRFKDMKMPEGNVVADVCLPEVGASSNSVVLNECLAQDLMSKFADTVGGGGSNSKDKGVIDLCKDSDESLTNKRNRPDEDSDTQNSAIPKFLKTDIKIEKD